MKDAVKAIKKKAILIFGFLSALPFRSIKNDTPKPEYVSHSDWAEYLSKTFNKKGMRILELGSRNVTGSNFRGLFCNAEYVGFDFYAGENVDVVGDAHKLSTYFKEEDKFDLVFSSAVFEHLHMPWVAAMEIQKVLKVGGFVFIETHFSFSSHERPWHFFQFSDMGLRALFNNSLGFDLIDSGMSNPMTGYFSHNAAPRLKYRPVLELYCHSEILCKKRCEVERFQWDNVTMDGIVEGARYPAPIGR